MANPAKGEVRFEHDGREYCLHFGMVAIDWFEDTFDKPWLGAVQHVAVAQEAGVMPKTSTLVSILQAGLVKFHPELATVEARDDILALATNPEVQKKMGLAVAVGMPDAGSAEGNAPKPKKSNRKGLTSKAGSDSLSKAA